MKPWLRRLRGALLMGLVWAVVWMPAGLVLGMILDPDGTMDEPWILVGTLPGFFAGVMFSIVLGIAAARRKLEDLSVRRVAGWGAVAGLALGALWSMAGDQGPDVRRVWLLPLVVITSLTVLSAVSAGGSLMLARKSERRELPEGTPDAVEVGVGDRDAQELPGGRR